MFSLGGESGQTRQFRAKVGDLENSLRQRGGEYSAIRQRNSGEVASYQPQVRDTLGLLTGMVNRGATATDKTRFVNSQTADVAGAYERAKAGLDASLAQRGLSDSSIAAGSQAVLSGQRAGAIGQATNAANNYFDERQFSRTQGLLQLLQSLYQNAQGQEGAALAGQTGIDQGLMGVYSNMFQNSQARDAQQAQQILALLGQAGTMYGKGG